MGCVGYQVRSPGVKMQFMDRDNWVGRMGWVVCGVSVTTWVVG